MKRLPVLLGVILAALVGGHELGLVPALTSGAVPGAQRSDDALRAAFDNRTSDLQIRGVGTVVKVLPDDDEGSRHQRFVLRTGSGQTLLVAHNIDLAERVRGLEPGDRVEFNGEYEWNARGGVIHWTHHDPQGRHEPGWLRHAGRTYE